MISPLRRTTVALSALAIAISLEAIAWACPGCKEATSEQGANLARGFSYSILFMMPIPFLIVGSFGGYAYYTMRRRDREQSASSTPPEPPTTVS